MITVIDNYDSFTYNLVQQIERLAGERVRVLRNDAFEPAALVARRKKTADRLIYELVSGLSFTLEVLRPHVLVPQGPSGLRPTTSSAPSTGSSGVSGSPSASSTA